MNYFGCLLYLVDWPAPLSFSLYQCILQINLSLVCLWSKTLITFLFLFCEVNGHLFKFNNC